jgi:hypothetical protein
LGHTESPGGRETLTSDDAPQISQRIGVPSSVVVGIILDRANDHLSEPQTRSWWWDARLGPEIVDANPIVEARTVAFNFLVG